MNKTVFCNYAEKAQWARKWIKSKNKILLVKRFCNRFPERYNHKTWSGRTIARNCLVVWANKYNEGTLKPKITRGNTVPKRKVSINELDPSDREVYQEIVDELIRDHNISKDEIANRMRKKKEKLKNQKKMSGTFDLSNKIFYRVIKRKKTRLPKNNEELIKIIRLFKKGLNRNLGHEKTREKLLQKGLINANTSLWDVRMACVNAGLTSNRVGRKSNKPKEKKDTKYVMPNLIKDMKINNINIVWSTDVSYLKVKAGFVFLSAVIDNFSKKIIGYKISTRNDTDLVIESIMNKANENEWPKIIHSDNGYQYTSKRFIKLMNERNIKLSKSYPGRSLENREIEFWFGLLKREQLYKNKYTSISKIKTDVEEYVIWYNEERIKKNEANNLAWMTPKEVHAYYSH